MPNINAVTNKRERELARAKYERQTKRRQSKMSRKTFLKVTAYSVVGLAMLSYLVLPKNDSVEPISTPSTTAAAAPVVDGCTTATTPRTDNISYTSAPIDAVAATNITFTTNCGDIAITTDKKAPRTTGVISYLVANKFYHGIKCHRLTTDGIYVLQCGDPAGNGTGGPGFKFDDENLPKAGSDGSAIYARGTVAMANSGPNTNGSQFFLVYQDSPLPPNYSVWGQITTGLNRLDAIAKAGVSGGTSDGAPLQEVVISAASTTP
jgi:peptidyl-prolyl cis-trans isomerase B (cyclophilin B)